VLRQLAEGELTVLGRVSTASNVALLGHVTLPDADPVRVMYKPIRGEQPLWDFPHGTLAEREAASYLLSATYGWDLVPPTVVRDGPYGPGSVQRWIGDPLVPGAELTDVVDVFAVGAVPDGWLTVAAGEGRGGHDVLVAHEDAADLRSMAVFDAVINNSDRKGSHCARDAGGRLWGFDQAVTFHEEPKLRTVLWGWAGMPVPKLDLDRLAALGEGLAPSGRLSDELATLLPALDVVALRRRVRTLLAQGKHPEPAPGWPSIPWPAL